MMNITNPRNRHMLTGTIAGVLLLAWLHPAYPAPALDLWPMLEIADDSTTVLYPFYVHEGDFLMVFPLYYRTGGGREQHFVWPLVKFTDWRLARVVPVWFNRQNGNFALIPLIYQTPESTLWFIPPVYFRQDGSFSAFFPFYLRTAHSYFVLPNIYWRTAAGQIEKCVIFPFWDYEKMADGRYADILWIVGRNARGPYSESWFLPFMYRYADKDSSWLWLLPYYQERSLDDSFSAIYPFFCKKQTKDSSRLWLFPYYQKRTPVDSLSAVYPFFHQQQENDYRSFWLMPFFTSSSLSHSRTALYPFFSLLREQRDNELEQSLLILWPVYSRKVVNSEEGEMLERYRRFLFFSDEIDRSDIRTLRFFGFPIYEQTR